jgi:hypothetical protein
MGTGLGSGGGGGKVNVMGGSGCSSSGTGTLVNHHSKNAINSISMTKASQNARFSREKSEWPVVKCESPVVAMT